MPIYVKALSSKATEKHTAKLNEAYSRSGIDGRVLQMEDTIFCQKLQEEIDCIGDPKLSKMANGWIKAELAPCHQGKGCVNFYQRGNVEICNTKGTGTVDIQKLKIRKKLSKSKFKPTRTCVNIDILPGQFAYTGKKENKKIAAKKKHIEKVNTALVLRAAAGKVASRKRKAKK